MVYLAKSTSGERVVGGLVLTEHWAIVPQEIRETGIWCRGVSRSTGAMYESASASGYVAQAEKKRRGRPRKVMVETAEDGVE